MKPLVIDLYCGLGGWTKGFLEAGYDAVGFDIQRHQYGDKRYPGQLVLQDARTLHGSQCRNAAVIVASPPCQKYSWMAMPWDRAKREGRWQKWEHDSPFGDFRLNDLFDTCFRIQREASEAAGRYIPLVVENVKGAQPWVGRAKAHFGSYYLWGDVESVGGRITIGKFGQSLRPAGKSQKFNPDGTAHGQGSWFAVADSKNRGSRAGAKVPGLNWSGSDQPGYVAQGFNVTAAQHIRDGQKNEGGSWFNVAHNTESGHGQNPVNGLAVEGVKQRGSGAEWFDEALNERRRDATAGMKGNGGGWFEENDSPMRKGNSKSDSRKAASALIAEIPPELARWIAECFKPDVAQRLQPRTAGGRVSLLPAGTR